MVDDRSPPAARRFYTTQWSLVLAAGNAESPDFNEAMADLCGRYWHPIYSYIRRRGVEPTAAEDLAQGFFVHLLERNSVGSADPQRGRFRSFLLAALKYYMADEWDRAQAKKRGGGQQAVELDADSAESRYQLESNPEETPDQLFARRWAEELLEHAQARLNQELERSRNPERSRRLAEYLTGDAEAKYSDLAAELGMTESAVKVTVHRLRKRFGELLREEVQSTVEGTGEVDDEIRFLFAALGR